MIFYHGTILQFAAKIKTQGLKPHIKGETFKLAQPLTYGMATADPEPGVFLTTKKAVALQFARFKAEYMRASYGSTLMWQGAIPMVKRDAHVIPDATPCLVLVEYDLAELVPDTHSSEDMGDYRSVSPIPASAIKGVQTI